MAQQKMHGALRRTYSYIQKREDGENGSLSRKSLDQHNLSTSSKDCDVPSVVWRNFSHSCAFLTFFTLEPDGQWRVFAAVPLQYPDHTTCLGSGAQVNMDGHLVSASPVSPLKVDRQKVQKGLSTGRSCSIKQLTAKNFFGSDIQHQSRKKGYANKEDKVVKRKSRKKVKKKGNRSKKFPGDTGLTELDAHGSSTSETGPKKELDYGVGLLPYSTMAVSLPEHGCNRNCSEGKHGGTINCSATSKTCISCMDEVDVSEALVPSAVQDIVSEYDLSSSENGRQGQCPEFLILNGVLQDTQDTLGKSISCFDDPHSNVLSETKDALVLESVSLGSVIDESFNAGHAFKLSNAERAGNDLSESPGFISSKGCFPRVESYGHAERANCGGQGSSSGDRCSEVGKSEKQNKRAPRNSSVKRISSVGNLHGRSGKENNHSVWQKVQRVDADECNYELRKVNSVCSQFDLGLEEAPLVIKQSNVVDSDMLPKFKDKSQTRLEVSRKVKRKTSPGPKQECYFYSRKGSHAIKTCPNISTKISMQQNGILNTPAQMQKELENVPRSYLKTRYQRIEPQNKRVESILVQRVHSSQVCMNELEPLESVYSTVSSLNDQTKENQTSSLSRSFNSLESSELLEELSAIYLHAPVGSEEKEVSSADCNKQDSSFGAVLHKSIPIGENVSGLLSLSQPTNLSMEKVDEPTAESWILENLAEQELVADCHTLVSSINEKLTCIGQSPENENGLPFEDKIQVLKLKSESTCPPNGYCNNYASKKCLIYESTGPNINASENDSSNVAWAVNDVHKVQLACQAIQIATGCPVAEFERLLHSASPVICPLQNIVSCQICSHDQVVGASLCRHETPNISLGSLWQWYEKHGSYGLEVRAEDYENSKRLGIDRFAFRGYFVPLLSAVQLFRKCSSHPTDNSNEIPGTEATEAFEMDKTSESSIVSHLPIFSVLVPQAHNDGPGLLPQENHVCYSEPPSACIKDNVSIHPIDSERPDDLELLFEYFESEQPQRRRPLYEMIKELIRGDGSSKCRAYGDPTILDSANLHDLHPKSWYSVAWYPIYRIPDGNFRAAFLTYHSLGHLVHRGSSFDSLCVDACVVSPVVGLQSYNAQGECWFRSRHSGHWQTSDIPNSYSSVILKERLRTLEQTASLMARALVTKGSQTCMNRQPDYEFFLSRRRY